ncbi:MAG: hypothetical protein ACTSXP_16640 [Promethearchaeota archaeon]
MKTNKINKESVIFTILILTCFILIFHSKTANEQRDELIVRTMQTDGKMVLPSTGIETLSSWWNESWDYRRKITLVEPGLMNRTNEPINVFLNFSGNEAHEGSLRVASYDGTVWTEIESQVWNATMHSNGTDNFYDSCTITFFYNISLDSTEILYVYYDPEISSTPAYTDHITVRGVNAVNITDDTRMPNLLDANGSVLASNIDSFEIITNDGSGFDYSSPQAAVCLVDTMRGQSDWGGPSIGIVRAEYNGSDALSIADKQWMSIGEMALDAIAYDSVTNQPNGFSGNYRVNVGPDNPAEAWDGNGKVEVLDDGPLFTRIHVQTTDGAFASIYPRTGAGSAWFLDDLTNLANVDDTVTRNDFNTDSNGGIGYVKYNITYTFYYYGSHTFVKIDFDFGAFPQRGRVGSGYPVENANYLNDTVVAFKNYGDWPHLMQLVSSDWGYPTKQDMKSWYGSKYGYWQEYIGERRRDYPLEPWTAWWDNDTGSASDPTIGMFAVTNGIGWEVLTLAVNGIGNNSLLQQILPEGHQGDQFILPNGTILSYNYYLFTSAFGTNDTMVREMCLRMNEPVLVQVGDVELFKHNSMFIHVNDSDGNTALGTLVRLYNQSTMTLINSSYVDSNGNVTFLRLPDGVYTVHVVFYTDNLLNEYVAHVDRDVVLNHLAQANRSIFKTYNASIANLTFKVVNWARENELLTGAQIRIRNVSNGNIVEQNLTWDGHVSFRLYCNGSTEYNIEVWYGGVLRTINISNTYTFTNNSVLNIGVAIETTSLTIVNESGSAILGTNYSLSFIFHESNNVSKIITAEKVNVSDRYDSGYWTFGVDYYWWHVNSTHIGLNLTSGAGTKLNHSGSFEIYIHTSNTTAEEAIEKVFIFINDIPTNITITLNDSISNEIQVYHSEMVYLEVDYLDAISNSDITGATVNFTIANTTYNIPYNASAGNYSAIIDTSSLDVRTYVVNVRASITNYETGIQSIVIFVMNRPATIITTLNDSSTNEMVLYRGELISLEVVYLDWLTGAQITDATVNFTLSTLTGLISYNISTSNYSTLIDTNSLLEGTYTLKIRVNRTYYEVVVSSLLIQIRNRPATISLSSPGSVQYGEPISINVMYKDGLDGTPINITTGDVTSFITGFPAITPVITLVSTGTFNIIYDSWSLNALGGYDISVQCNWSGGAPYYINQSDTITVTLIRRQTQLYTAETYGEKPWGSNFTVNAFYIDSINSTSINNSTGYVSISVSCTSHGANITTDDVVVSYNAGILGWDIEFNYLAFPGPNPSPFYIRVDFNWTDVGQPFYINQTKYFNITISAAHTRLTILPGGQTQISGLYHNVTFFFSNEITGDGINLTADGETLQQNVNITTTHTNFNASIYDPANNLTSNGTDGYFTVYINITAWSEKNIHIFNVSVNVTNFNVATLSFSLITVPNYTIIEIESVQEGFLGQDVNITAFYHYQSVTSSGIAATNVFVSSNETSDYWIEGVDYDWSFNPATDRHVISIHTGINGTRIHQDGTFSFFINMSAPGSEAQRVRVIITVAPMPTDIKVIINETDITSSTIYELPYTTRFNVTTYYYYTFGSPTNITQTASVILTNGTHNWTLNPAGNGYSIEIGTETLGPSMQYAFTLICSNNSMETYTFRFYIFPRDIDTELIVEDAAFNRLQPQESISANWSDVIEIYCRYNDTLNNKIITLQTVTFTAIIGSEVLHATVHDLPSGYWRFSINTAMMPVLVGGTTIITFRANNTGYKPAEQTIQLFIKPIEITLENLTINDQFLILNGGEKNYSKIQQWPFLGEQAIFNITLTTWNDMPVNDASIFLIFSNDTNQNQDDIKLPANASGNVYTIMLDLNVTTFYAKQKFIYLYIQKENYSGIVEEILVTIRPIRIDTLHVSGINIYSDTLVIKVGNSFNFTIQLYDNVTNSPYTSRVTEIRVYMTSPQFGDRDLVYIGDGKFSIKLTAPLVEGTYPLTIIIDVPADIELQYEFDTTPQTFYVRTQRIETIPPVVFYIVLFALIGLIIYFILYQVRFKYPKMVRKIHDMKSAVHRGKKGEKIRNPKVKSREENIFFNYARILNQHSFLQTKDTKYAAKASGYAPVPDESIALEFELPSLDFEETTPLEKPVAKREVPTVIEKPPKAETKLKVPSVETKPVTRTKPVSLPKPLPKPAAKQPPKPTVMKITRPLPSARLKTKPAPKPIPRPAQKPPKKLPTAPLKPRTTKPVSHENLYQQLVLLEQKRYKAERSLRDLNAKLNRGLISENEYNEYNRKLNESLEKIKNQITDIRRKLISL